MDLQMIPFLWRLVGCMTSATASQFSCINQQSRTNCFEVIVTARNSRWRKPWSRTCPWSGHQIVWRPFWNESIFEELSPCGMSCLCPLIRDSINIWLEAPHYAGGATANGLFNYCAVGHCICAMRYFKFAARRPIKTRTDWIKWLHEAMEFVDTSIAT